MRQTGIGTADEFVQLALRTLHQSRGEDFDDLDPEPQAAIERGLAEADRGKGQPWEQVREEIRARFIK